MLRVDELLVTWYKKLSVKFKIAFMSVIVVGLIAHIYMFTNKLPNFDDLVDLNSFGVTFKNGRWFLWIVGAVLYHLDFVFSLPWVNGIVTLLFLGISAGLIADMFDMQSNIANAIVGAAIIVFPSWTTTFFYMFTAPYYGFAVFLAVLSVYATCHWGKTGFLISSVMLCLSMGIYQAYLPFTATLYVVLLIVMLYEEYDYIAIVKRAFYYLGALAAGVVLYFVSMKLSLMITGQQLNSYKGISSMGNFSLDRIPEIAKSIGINFFGVFLNNNLEISYNLVTKVMYLVLMLVTILLTIGLISSLCKKKQYLKVGATFVLLLAYVLAINSIYIMCADGIYVLMYFSYVFLMILPLVLLDKTLKYSPNNIVMVKRLCVGEWIVVLSLVMGIASYCHYANAQYLTIQLSFEQATSYFTTLITQIKSVSGYADELPVAFVGFDIDDKTLYRNEVMNPVQTSGRDNTLVEAYSRVDLLRYYCGFAPEYVSTEQLPTDRIKEMPVYPAEGSIQVIDGVIVVKLADK